MAQGGKIVAQGRRRSVEVVGGTSSLALKIWQNHANIDFHPSFTP
jgi:hypothetical protein